LFAIFGQKKGVCLFLAVGSSWSRGGQEHLSSRDPFLLRSLFTAVDFKNESKILVKLEEGVVLLFYFDRLNLIRIK
jgi:hypothetical protein